VLALAGRLLARVVAEPQQSADIAIFNARIRRALKAERLIQP
jgi:hypothetical protein